MIGLHGGQNPRYVGIAQMIISETPNDVLVAASLGSCLGIAVFDRNRRMGGLIHCLLPTAQTNPERAKNEPYTFVDTGLVSMLNQLVTRGCQRKDLVISVAGGSNINDDSNVFEIGKKNHTMLRKVLWKNNLLIKAEHIGDRISRTVSLHIDTGEVWVKFNGTDLKLSQP